MYLHIDDVPEANIVQYFPKSVAFISNALNDQTSNVLVHCVHGQSRSCAVVVAYLMAVHLRECAGLSRYIDEESTRLLHDCYEIVQQARPCMAINPGFVQQLEIYRRMLFRRREMLDNQPVTTQKMRTFRAQKLRNFCIRKY